VLKDCLKQIKLQGDGDEEPGELRQQILIYINGSKIFMATQKI